MPAEPVIAAVPEDPVVRVARAALAVPEDLVVPAVRAVLVAPENPVVLVALANRAAVQAPAIVPVVALELAIVLAAAQVPAIDPAEVPEPETVQVEAAQGHDRVEVPLRTRSVTAAHHRDLVAGPRVEDLAPVAETLREPAAAEAATVWAAVE